MNHQEMCKVGLRLIGVYFVAQGAVALPNVLRMLFNDFGSGMWTLVAAASLIGVGGFIALCASRIIDYLDSNDTGRSKDAAP